MEWISVKDRLPDDGDMVWGYGFIEAEIEGRTNSRCVENGEWRGSYIDMDTPTYYCWIVDVTHWMPFDVPSPPTDWNEKHLDIVATGGEEV